jgi:hypothetical protein
LQSVNTISCLFCGAEFEPRNAQHKYCSRSCVRKAHYYRNHKAEIERRRRQNQDVATRMHYRVKHRAIRKKVPFEIDVSDIQVPDVCPVLGIKLNCHQGKRGCFSDSPSLDRIRPTLGYVKGNIRVISARANLLKSDATVDELSAVLDDLRRYA